MYYYTHYWTQALNKKSIPIVIFDYKINYHLLLLIKIIIISIIIIIINKYYNK